MKQTAWDHDLLLESPYPVITEEPVSWGRKGERLTLAERHKAIVEANSGKVFSIVSKDYSATPEIRWTHFVFSRGPGESCRFRDILEELHR